MTNKKSQFNEILSELMEFATVSGNLLTKEQISLYFKDIIDDESKYEDIYRYLTSQKINIEGYTPKENPEADLSKEESDIFIGVSESEMAKSFHQMYHDELTALSTNPEKKEEAFHKYITGDTSAVEELTHLYLPAILDICDNYLNSPLPKSDLVAEGNLALFQSIIAFQDSSEIKNFSDFENYLLRSIHDHIKTKIDEEIGSKRTNSHLVQRINRLNDVTTELAKELGREATLLELSEALSFSEEEIKELMKISIDALSTDNGDSELS